MLQKQRGQREFTGGLEAARLKSWHAKALKALRTKRMAAMPYDFRDGVDPNCLCHETVMGKTCPVHPPIETEEPKED